MLDDFQRAESRDCPMSSCAAPAGSPCRTAKGKAAVQYHTARFRLEPSLAKVLNVPTPGVRKPGAKTVTSAVRGCFRSSDGTRAEAMSLLMARH